MTDAKGDGNLLQVLRERGFVHQTTDDETADKPLRKLLDSERVTAYIGFDPTAPSLHVGNLVQIMGLLHLQRCGHRPVVVMGGGTGLVGDPSGKTEMRQLLVTERIQANLQSQREQFTRYLDLTDEDRGLVVNNAEWLVSINYIEFLRDIGRHFSVNRMLAAESVKLRLDSEGGLSFLEFNYSLLQAYDFLVLYRDYGCKLQMGGSDQWGNIVAGVDLVRRVEGSEARAHGVTLPLLTTAAGHKMGKTEKGAVWLDSNLTSPYDYYQYWINSDDRDVLRFLRFFTLLSLEEIEELGKLEGADIRQAKKRLAYEATKLTHGQAEAKQAQEAAEALFAGQGGPQGGVDQAPSFMVSQSSLESGILLVEVAAASGLCDSKNAARRLARQSGLYVHGKSVDENYRLSPDDQKEGAILLRAGKKRHMRILVD